MKPPIDAWLTFIASHLRGKNRTCELAYDDERQGDLLALTVPGEAGLCELDVRRRERGASLVLCAQSAAALRALLDVLGPLHRSVSRLENARRKFVHRVERMAEHLLETFEERSQQFPVEALQRLRELFPEAEPMVGIEGLYREREHEPESVAFTPGEAADKRLAKEASQYPSRFAASVPTPAGGRAALYEPERAGFRLVGAAHSQLAERLQRHGSRAPVEFAVSNDPNEPVRTAAAAGTGYLAGASCGDCGGLDMPDCDVVELPDCGSCDIST